MRFAFYLNISQMVFTYYFLNMWKFQYKFLENFKFL